ncbi:LuxR C-terminal-related transcriptional regulator [Streptomyces sp. NPDC056638]|uniref:LuxR C-terminal-related transcriptional regulator n=1 Tax=unclassified Streptomyces TaxID=2593676 RepID=UPI0036267BC0
MSKSGLGSQKLSPATTGFQTSEQYRDLYRSIFMRSGICMANLDLQFRILEANGSFVTQLGLLPADIHGTDFLRYLHPSMQGKFRYELTRLADGQNARFTDQVIAVDAQGAPFEGGLTGIAVGGSAGRVGSLMALFQPSGSERPGVASTQHKLFSPVHAHILEGVAVGESTVQMAARLFLSRGGVEYHVASLLRKMKAANRPALISKGFALGVFAVGEWPPHVRSEFISP